jgi:hypothetical protein
LGELVRRPTARDFFCRFENIIRYKSNLAFDPNSIDIGNAGKVPNKSMSLLSQQFCSNLRRSTKSATSAPLQQMRAHAACYLF